MEAYTRALAAVVRPGMVVVDLGAGTGIFSLIACRLGATRVFAIDTNPAIELGRELANENGVADRIEFICEDARRVRLPTKADVVVSDLRGALPLSEAHLEVLMHAREHFLARGGVLVPESDEIRGAVVASGEVYDRALGRTEIDGGVTLRSMRARLANSVYSDRFGPPIRRDQLATAGRVWAKLDYQTATAEPVAGILEWSIETEMVLGYGICLWFESVLAGPYRLTSEPGRLDAVYPRLFLPWPQPVELRRGDRVRVRIWAHAEGDPWGWSTEVSGKAGSIRFKQSSFLGAVSRPKGKAGERQGVVEIRGAEVMDESDRTM